ncbi:MAG: Fic family protein [Bacteroidia bacterium]|jgi:Fic family protein
MYSPDKPYNKLPLLPPKLTLTPKVYNKAIQANKALAELKGMTGLIPNPVIILDSLVLREARDSSAIENIVTTQDELYKAYSVGNTDLNAAVKEVLNYKQAMWLGYELIKKKKLITTRELMKIQECLMGNNAGIRNQPGTALKQVRTGKVIYTPPFGKDIIQDKLKNLEEYINGTNEDMDPLIRMGIMHYQFESIHPFYDGNGRTGRILNVLYLIHEGLLELPILYLSSFIIKQKKQYYKGLNNVRQNRNWEEWIVYMLESVAYSATDTIKTIRGIKLLLEKTIEKVKLKRPKIYSKELVEVLFHQPYARISALEDQLGITRFTASKYLKDLEKIGVLKGEKVGRDMLYINIDLFNLLKAG